MLFGLERISTTFGRRSALVAIVTMAGLFATPAAAQDWQHPNWKDGSVPTPVWVTKPRVGNGVADATGTSAQGGTPPAVQFEPPVKDEVGYKRAPWLVKTNLYRLQQGEAKFRVTCDPAFGATFDPILFRGKRGTGHHHTFIGNLKADENFDYEAGRLKPGSSCAGGPLNGTLYWEPSLMEPSTSGVVRALKPNVISFYYTHSYKEAPRRTRLVRDFRFIGGNNPMDMSQTAIKAEIDNANAALGLKGSARLQYPDRGLSGWRGWVCQNSDGKFATVVPAHAQIVGTTSAKYLQGPNGEDPFGGTCTSGVLVSNVTAPVCWDGHNLGAPDGRGHVRYSTNTMDNAYTDLCPDGWWRVPAFEAKTEYAHKGFNDYKDKFLSSDRMNPANTPPDPTSTDPCRRVGPWFCNGATMHFDWWGSWDQTIMDIWLAKCNGVSLPGGFPTPDPLTCGYSTISSTERMISDGAPPVAGLSNNPVVAATTFANASDSIKYFAAEAGVAVPPADHDHGTPPTTPGITLPPVTTPDPTPPTTTPTPDLPVVGQPSTDTPPTTTPPTTTPPATGTPGTDPAPSNPSTPNIPITDQVPTGPYVISPNGPNVIHVAPQNPNSIQSAPAPTTQGTPPKDDDDDGGGE